MMQTISGDVAALAKGSYRDLQDARAGETVRTVPHVSTERDLGSLGRNHSGGGDQNPAI